MAEIEIHIRPGAEADDRPVDQGIVASFLEPWLAAVGGREVCRDNGTWQVFLPQSSLPRALKDLRQRCLAMNLRASGGVVWR